MLRLAACAVFAGLAAISFLWGSVSDGLMWLIFLLATGLVSAVYELVLDLARSVHNGR